MEFYEILAITLPIAFGAVLASRIALNRPKSADKYKTKLDNSRERYIEELEDDLHDAKQSLNSRERGPKISGDMNQMEMLLPELVGSFSDFAPKWLKPFLGNKAIQTALIEKIKADPDKYAGYISKLLKPDKTSEGNISSTTSSESL